MDDYQLSMHDWPSADTPQVVQMTREEYEELKRHLARIRGFDVPDQTEHPDDSEELCAGCVQYRAWTLDLTKEVDLQDSINDVGFMDKDGDEITIPIPGPLTPEPLIVAVR